MGANASKKIGINLNKLPQKLIEGTKIAGKVSSNWANKLGINEGSPIFNTGVDVGPATIGTGVFGTDTVTVTLGTSMNAALVTKKPLLNRKLIIWPYVYKPKEYYYNFAGANTAGAIVAWFIKEFSNADTKQLDKSSENIPVSSNGITVLPFFMGERSLLWDSDIRETILGISLSTTKLDIYNAFQEAIAFSVRQSIEQFGENIGNSITVVGGVSNSSKMLHFISDITGKNVNTTKSGGESDLGSDILAGIGINVLTPDKAQKWSKINEVIEPNLGKHKLYNRFYQKYKEAYKFIKPYYQNFDNLGK